MPGTGRREPWRGGVRWELVPVHEAPPREHRPRDAGGGRRHADTLRRLEPVLAGLRFPARRWQILVHADLRGTDVVTRRALDTLPDRLFGDVAAVAAEVRRGSAPR